jgi:xylan 1,4-beta-xylosidase
MKLVLIALGLLVTVGCKSDTTLITIQPQTVMNVTGKDDVQQLKRLASGVGWEFESNEAITARLRQIGIKTFRCINVDPLPGKFADDGSFVISDEPTRLQAHLQTCREVGANPHVIIGTGLPPELRLNEEDLPPDQRGIMGNAVKTALYGPKDWDAYEAYIEAYLEYVIIKQGFPEAEFEVANEPDTSGEMYPAPPRPAMGSAALYQGYMLLYTHIADAAHNFEADHPGMHVHLGGPALAWAFTFKYGDFNWATRFLQDCHNNHIKLDFLGVHFYGNIASLHGEYPGNYPSFMDMLKTTQQARDQYFPGLPIEITEWGASYQTSNDPPSLVNGNYIGAAWGADFLDTMMESGVDSALYLVTTDLRQQAADGTWQDVWGWPALFVNPQVFGGQAYPKATFNLFDMISRLVGQRVQTAGNLRTVGLVASADAPTKSVTVLLWNYGYQIPEGGAGTEHALPEPVTLRVGDAGKFFGGVPVSMQRWEISEGVSDASTLFAKEGKLDDRCELQQVDKGTLKVSEDHVDTDVTLPPSSVSLVVLSPAAQ